MRSTKPSENKYRNRKVIVDCLSFDSILEAHRYSVLRSRLYDLELEKKRKEEASLRKNQVGTGDRSEKIRTYNFPQGRCTDHRIKLTLHRLEQVMNGDLDEIIDSLIAADQAAKLSSEE